MPDSCTNRSCIANSCDGKFCQLECLAESAPHLVREFRESDCGKFRKKAGELS
jgi:hypothetical protein